MAGIGFKIGLGQLMAEYEPVSKSLVDELTSRLREAILTGRIPAGARMRVRDLQERYGVSSIPIREAIRRLESEALIESKPHRGACAAEMSIRQLDDLYDLRRMIEIATARRAVYKHTAESLATLASDIMELDDRFAAGSSDDFEVAHRRFHWDLLAPGSTNEIERVLLGIWERTGRYVRLAMTAFHSGPVGQTQHHHLHELCLAGDAAGVGNELENHLTLTQNSIHRWYESQEADHEPDRRPDAAERPGHNDKQPHTVPTPGIEA
jgi:DNA-binding GntR family transcriptional regulator